MFSREISLAAGRRVLTAVSGLNRGLCSFTSRPQQMFAAAASSQRAIFRRPPNQTAVVPHPAMSLFTKSDALDTMVRSDPKKGDLVYVGTLAKMVRVVKVFSLSTSLAGLVLQPVIYNQASQLHWALALMVGSVAGFFVFVTPLLLHLVTKRYVTKMYLNRDTGVFTATTYSLLLREKEHVFTPSELKVPNVPGLFTTVRIKDKVPIFIDPTQFIDKQAFVQMMQYDEPLDWEIPEHTKKTE